jgi:Cytochrome c554 and c-prime
MGGRTWGKPVRCALTLGVLVLLACLALVSVAAAATTTTTVATTPEGEPICVTCHASVSPEVVRTWRSQNHGQHQVGCPVCHGGHDQDFHPLPLAEVCFGCHDVAKIHGGDFTPSTPGARCMECHTSNVHWLPGPESWFQGGLPPQDLVAGPPPPKVSAATGTVAGVVGALLAVAVGVLLGVVLNRFIRGL